MKIIMGIAIAGMAVVQCQSMQSRARMLKAQIEFQKKMDYCNTLLTNADRAGCFTVIADHLGEDKP